MSPQIRDPIELGSLGKPGTGAAPPKPRQEIA